MPKWEKAPIVGKQYKWEEAPVVEEKQPGDQPGFFGKAYEETKAFIKGAEEEPVRTIGGLVGGAAEGVLLTGARSPEKETAEYPPEFRKKHPDVYRPTGEAMKGVQETIGLDPMATKQYEEESAQAALKEKEKSIVGKRARSVGEFSGKVAAGLGLSSLVPGSGVVPTLAKGAVANLPFAASEGLERGTKAFETDMVANTVIDAMFIGMGKMGVPAKKLAGKAMQGAATKLQNIIIKATDPVIKKGFKIENVFKYAAEGDLAKTNKLVNEKILHLSKELKSKIEDPNNFVAIDLEQVLNKASESLSKKRGDIFGDILDVEKFQNKVFAEIEALSPSGVVDIAQAQRVKRSSGLKGAWLHGHPDKEASAMAEVYNQFYFELKKEIERLAPEGVKEINKALSELIPIQRAMVHRIPVAQRNEVLPLKSMIGAAAYGPKGWALLAANTISTSPVGIKPLYRGGEKLLKEVPEGLKTKRTVGKELYLEEMRKEEKNKLDLSGQKIDFFNSAMRKHLR